jgi:hypothetical protein
MVEQVEAQVCLCVPTSDRFDRRRVVSAECFRRPPFTLARLTHGEVT